MGRVERFVEFVYNRPVVLAFNMRDKTYFKDKDAYIVHAWYNDEYITTAISSSRYIDFFSRGGKYLFVSFYAKDGQYGQYGQPRVDRATYFRKNLGISYLTESEYRRECAKQGQKVTWLDSDELTSPTDYPCLDTELFVDKLDLMYATRATGCDQNKPLFSYADIEFLIKETIATKQ